MNLFDLTGRTALVTGARTGLGQAMALTLAEAGSDIVGLGSSSMEETEALVRALGRRFYALQVDLSATFDAAEVLDRAEDALGLVSILVNNAGTIPPSRSRSVSHAGLEPCAAGQPERRLPAFTGRSDADEIGWSHRQHRVDAVLSGRHSRGLVYCLQARHRGVDPSAGHRTCPEGYHRERDCAGLFRNRQYGCVARRSAAVGRNPGAHPGGPLGCTN